MRILLAPLLLCALLLTGCIADQSRKARAAVAIDPAAIEYQVARHGGAGGEIAEIYNRGSFAENMRDTTGDSMGLLPVEYFHVQIAPDPTNAMVLETAGYIRKLERDRDSLFLYEFYDTSWRRIAILGMHGDLYRVDGTNEQHLGRFQLDAAATELYKPPSGYGYDALAQDRARVRMWDPDVAGADERARGVFHRGHNAAPPVLVIAKLSRGDAATLSERFARDRFNDREAERLNRLREARHGGVGQDEAYGGLRYKDGQPVDEHGRPLYRGALKD